ncbi:MAG: FhaA domain-containing protein [Actinomycetota bacterium]
MGVAKSIEQRLEGLVEGFFTKMFRSGLQPVEVGRRILREMGESKTVSVNRTYAPNEFRVFLSPDDHARFDQMRAGLEREFSELVIEEAKRQHWNLMGLPRVSFHKVDEMGTGELSVEASLVADEDVKGSKVSTHEPEEGSADSSRAVSSDTAARMGVVGSGAQLVVLDEKGNRKEKISITRQPVVIGRLSTCDVVLADSNVSRRHAELRREGSRWLLVDLGSTNGTLVNGKLAREHPLEDGDRLSFGTSEMVFEISGAQTDA